MQDQMISWPVKAQILPVFGELAKAIGPEFNKYLDVVWNALQLATQVIMDKNDWSQVYDCECCIVAYRDIVLGLLDINNEDVDSKYLVLFFY